MESSLAACASPTRATIMRWRYLCRVRWCLALLLGISADPAECQAIRTVLQWAGGQGAVSTTSGSADGLGTSATFNYPSAVAVCNNGSILVVVSAVLCEGIN